MYRGTALLIAGAVILAVIGVAGAVGATAGSPVGLAAAQDDTTEPNETMVGPESDENATEADFRPGERLSGVIGVQNAEISGEVDARSFEVAIDRATTDEERAAVVAERLSRTEARASDIAQRQQTLRERRNAGELSHGAYAARMAETAARAESVAHESNRSADVARELPAAVRTANGLDEDRLETVQNQARELRGPEAAAIARDVGGPTIGGPMAGDRRGPPNATPGGGDRVGAGGQGSPSERGGPGEDTDPGEDGSPGNASGPNGTNTNASNASGPGEFDDQSAASETQTDSTNRSDVSVADGAGTNVDAATDEDSRAADGGETDRTERDSMGTADEMDQAESDSDRSGDTHTNASDTQRSASGALTEISTRLTTVSGSVSDSLPVGGSLAGGSLAGGSLADGSLTGR